MTAVDFQSKPIYSEIAIFFDKLLGTGSTVPINVVLMVSELNVLRLHANCICIYNEVYWKINYEMIQTVSFESNREWIHHPVKVPSNVVGIKEMLFVFM